MTGLARQARVLDAAMNDGRFLSRSQGTEARELAWRLCVLLCGDAPGAATESAAHYKRTLEMINEREVM